MIFNAGSTNGLIFKARLARVCQTNAIFWRAVPGARPLCSPGFGAGRHLALRLPVDSQDLPMPSESRSSERIRLDLGDITRLA
ncbi:MAG: hypothetical protein ACREFB_04990, partial [Stellaceae bacterium]